LSLQGLGLRRIGTSAVVPDNPATRGLIKTVAHLVAVDE
jgi:large subunit ribosomal protein L30